MACLELKCQSKHLNLCMRTFWKLSEEFFRTFCGISKALLQIDFLFISVSKNFCQFLPVSPPLFSGFFCIFSGFFPRCMFLSFSTHFFRQFLYLPVFPGFTGLALFLLISPFFPRFFSLPPSCFFPFLYSSRFLFLTGFAGFFPFLPTITFSSFFLVLLC